MSRAGCTNKNYCKLAGWSNRIAITLWLVATSLAALAQANNYVVFFTDKANTPYSIDAPEEFLAARAISRRNRQQIAITEEDLPVDPAYVQGLAGVGAVSVRQTSKWFNAALVQASPAEAETLKQLAYVQSVAYIAPANVGGRIQKQLELDLLTEYASDTLLQNDLLDIGLMRAAGYQGQHMLIAVMDGGFAGMPAIAAFTDLFTDNRVLMAYDFITRTNDVYRYSDHGTKVMSLLAASQTAPDYAGVVPAASYLLFVTEDINYEYRVEEYRWLIAAEKADSAGADIISTSLGYNTFDDPLMDYSKSQLDGRTAVITRAAQKAANKGILFVTSGGNTGNIDPWENVLFPGDVIDGLAVGSITTSLKPSSFSPRGPTADDRLKPDVMAYGSGTYVINQSGNIVNVSGTSFAAPLVAGLAAGVWQAFPEVTAADLLAAIRFSSSNAATPDNIMGYGIPSYRAVSNYLAAEQAAGWFALYPNPVVNTPYLRIKIYDPIRDPSVIFTMFDTLGKPIASADLAITWQDNEYFLEMTGLPRGIYILNLQSGKNFSQVKVLKL